MKYHEYINKNQEIYEYLMSFIDEESDIEKHFDKINEIILKAKIQENPAEFKAFLHLISEIGKNHHRNSTFFTKIEKILSHYEEYIKQSFTNEDLLNVFEKNPPILYFLLKKNIITVDDAMIKLLHKEHQQQFIIRQYPGDNYELDFSQEKDKYYAKKLISNDYIYYFYLQVKSKLSENERSTIEEKLLKIDENIFDKFEEKCQIGENDSYISYLIRKDMIIEFIKYISKENISIKSNINSSIFETNPLLKSRQATLIEYAAFFGSIQIFNYLRMNNAEITPSLWIYAIHGNNAEMIHIIEDYHIEVEDKTFYIKCLKEAIKCHHNNIAHYFENNLIEESIEMSENNFKNNPIYYGFHYYNYEFIKYSENYQYLLYYACLYDHLPIVELLFKNKKVDLNKKIIYSIIYL